MVKCVKNKRLRKFYASKLLLFEITLLIVLITLYRFEIIDLFFLAYFSIVAIAVGITIYVLNNDGFYIDNYDYGRIDVKKGVLYRPFKIVCENVLVVHYKKGKKYNIVLLITNDNFGDKRIKPINREVIEENLEIMDALRRLKNIGEKKLFYIRIKKSRFIKETFLSFIYKTCVKAIYTEETIMVIKEYLKNKRR